MNYDDEKIWELITKDLAGEITSKEKLELLRWLEEDTENAALYREIRSSWEKGPVGKGNTIFLFDYESGLKKLRNKISSSSSVEQKFNITQSKVNRYQSNARKIAASMVILVISLSVYMAFQLWERPSSVTTYTTSANEQRIISLPDGSKVRMNRNSEIIFNKNLAGSTRTIRLNGEAFFDVTRNTRRPFIIQAGDALIKVLGTSFNVKNGNDVMVAVEEGLVAFTRKDWQDRDPIRLTAGQLGLLTQNSNYIDVENTDLENYMAWKNGYLTFDNMPLEKAMRQLERIYGISCEIKEHSISSLPLTVYTERTQLEEVLKTIALALDLNYARQGNTILWMKNKEKEMAE